MAVVRDIHGRALFQGLRKDAEEWLAKNFPWTHVNPPGNTLDEAKPDAVIEDEASDHADEEEE